jgi:transposase-like protein
MANVNRSGEQAAFWRDVVARSDASGLSVRAFCQGENLPESAFYFWRRKLAERDGDLPAKRRVTSKRALPAPAFVPVRIQHEALSMPTDPAQERPIGGVLWFSESTPAARIVEVIRALEARA